MSIMRRSKLAVLIAIILILSHIGPWDSLTAAAAQKNGPMVTLTQAGQVLDTITYNGVTVEAIYTNGPHSGSDVTYSCAAFVKKFYSSVYGINVYNLISTQSIPLVYDNKGSFSMTDQPRVGDIVRDNKSTHWAIVKAIDGDIITLIQQNYRSGEKAWFGCTIERQDTRFSYFTYSNRIEGGKTEEEKPEDANAGDANTEGANTDITGVAYALLPGGDGIYELFQAATMNLMNAPMNASKIDSANTLAEMMDGRVLMSKYEDSDRQRLSIVNLGEGRYSMQFLSDQNFLGMTEDGKYITSGISSQGFVFVERGNGLYSISPADNREYVLTSVQASSGGGQQELVLREYTGAMEELWYFNQRSTIALTLTPKEAENKKTLYTGYQDYIIRINQQKDNAAVTYSSSAPEIAAVDENGTVRPLKKGAAVITIQVQQDNISYQLFVAITVKDPYLKLTASEKELAAGESISIKAKKYGTKAAITWQVSDKSIAAIQSKTGELSAKKSGTVTVTAKTKDGVTAKIKIKVVG